MICVPSYRWCVYCSVGRRFLAVPENHSSVYCTTFFMNRIFSLLLLFIVIIILKNIISSYTHIQKSLFFINIIKYQIFIVWYRGNCGRNCWMLVKLRDWKQMIEGSWKPKCLRRFSTPRPERPSIKNMEKSLNPSTQMYIRLLMN